MIVILNTLNIPISLRIARQLAADYGERGVFVERHIAADAGFKKACGAVGQRIQAEKHAADVNLVLTGTFSSPQMLRRLRMNAGRYDDEVYAFRLPIRSALCAHLAAESGSETFRENYSLWLRTLDIGAGSGDMGYEIPITSLDPADTAQRIRDDIHAPVELVEYRDEWPAMFASEKARIIKALPELNLVVEQIGSTAIPGMPAKPILDILITIDHLNNAVACIQPLRQLGYAFIDYPQNIDRRFFRKGTPRSHHIHIVTHDSPSAQAYLRFRDALRTDAALRQEYLDLKRDSMQRFKHRRALYGERKGALIRKALA